MSHTELPTPAEPTGLLTHLLAVMADSKRTRVKELLRSGLVHVNGRSATQHDQIVGPRDRIEIRSERAAPPRTLPCEVLYEDAWLLAIDKPSGLLTVGSKHEKTRTAYALVNRALKETRERAFIVHRLDLYTSGVLLLAKSEEAQERIMSHWGSASKVYHALVEGVPAQRQRSLTHFLREDERLVMSASETATPQAVRASLSYRIEKSGARQSLLRIDLKTGKKNQIRAQLAAIGHPIVGDAKYGAQSNTLGRLCLHASSLSIQHPKTGSRLALRSALPPGMEKPR